MSEELEKMTTNELITVIESISLSLVDDMLREHLGLSMPQWLQRLKAQGKRHTIEDFLTNHDDAPYKIKCMAELVRRVEAGDTAASAYLQKATGKPPRE